MDLTQVPKGAKKRESGLGESGAKRQCWPRCPPTGFLGFASSVSAGFSSSSSTLAIICRMTHRRAGASVCLPVSHSASPTKCAWTSWARHCRPMRAIYVRRSSGAGERSVQALDDSRGPRRPAGYPAIPTNFVGAGSPTCRSLFGQGPSRRNGGLKSSRGLLGCSR
jgi:hypothetical protein